MNIEKQSDRNETIHKWILLVVALLFVALEFRAITLESHYKYDLIICMILLIGFYKIKAYIHLHWFHYLLFSLFLILHSLGMYQFYSAYPLGIEYDYWVHSYFGFISTLIMIRAFLLSSIGINLKTSIALTIMSVLGISAAHELYEFAGAMLFGEGDGVLFIGAGDIDEWDTQKDMLNNLIGSVVGVFTFFSYRKLSR